MHTCSELKIDNVNKVVYACVIMHNLLIERRPQQFLRKVAEQANPQDRGLGKKIEFLKLCGNNFFKNITKLYSQNHGI